MPIITGVALKLLAKAALTAVVAPLISEARDVALNTAQDTVRGVIAGRMSIDEWAEIIIKGVDSVKERVVSENDLTYVGGKLKFTLVGNDSETVSVSFELYFQDEFKNWHKAEADNDVPASKFISDDLDEMKTKGEVVYEVE